MHPTSQEVTSLRNSESASWQTEAAAADIESKSAKRLAMQGASSRKMLILQPLPEEVVDACGHDRSRGLAAKARRKLFQNALPRFCRRAPALKIARRLVLHEPIAKKASQDNFSEVSSEPAFLKKLEQQICLLRTCETCAHAS